MASARRSALVSLLCATALLSAGPVSAEDPDASIPPRVSGPLLGIPFECEDNGPAGAHQAKAQTCSWSYDLIPAETNLLEDFFAYWIQIEIDPGKGFCAKEIEFEMTGPNGGRIVSAMPDKSRRVAKRRPAVTELVVDADKAAPFPGTISNDVLYQPGRVSVQLNADRYSFTWRGNSRDKVMVAIGVQMTQPLVVPRIFSFYAESVGVMMGSCRPITIEAARY